MKAWVPPGLFPVLAHQGGWDEALLVLGPLALVGAALWIANRRVSAQLEEQAGPGEPNPDQID
jgi:cyanate permease